MMSKEEDEIERKRSAGMSLSVRSCLNGQTQLTEVVSSAHQPPDVEEAAIGLGRLRIGSIQGLADNQIYQGTELGFTSKSDLPLLEFRQSMEVTQIRGFSSGRTSEEVYFPERESLEHSKEVWTLPLGGLQPRNIFGPLSEHRKSVAWGKRKKLEVADDFYSNSDSDPSRVTGISRQEADWWNQERCEYQAVIRQYCQEVESLQARTDATDLARCGAPEAIQSVPLVSSLGLKVGE
uniref:Uncharacterized protein n=1 Tax=Sphaerodactylus townsendi TaxID=933632 RepID=A0ACB8GC05_9SAUR